MHHQLRVVVADDERPARLFLIALLRGFEDVELVGEAANGTDAVEVITRERPDLALLDLQMPELDGLGVARRVQKSHLPLFAFVTAYDDYAIRAFEMHAVDYLLKPVAWGRLRETLNRAHERLERADFRAHEAAQVSAASESYQARTEPAWLTRLPVRHRDAIVLLATQDIVSIVANGELLLLTTRHNERYTINYRLKDLALRLDPQQFVRLSRGALANVNFFKKITQLPGGTYTITLSHGPQLTSSRLQSRTLRDQWLKL